jgi:hypothetical protein
MNLFFRLMEQLSAFALDTLPQRLAQDDADAEHVEALRCAMLRLLDDTTSKAAATLRLRIRCAASVRSLWFMRGDVMAVLSQFHGEFDALNKVEDACGGFRGVLPKALRAGPSALSRKAHDYASLPHQRE